MRAITYDSPMPQPNARSTFLEYRVKNRPGWQRTSPLCIFLAANPVPDGTLVLVTSTFHMPHAWRSFEAAGWDGLVPDPVEYRTRSFANGIG
jgi:hypothetical protein